MKVREERKRNVSSSVCPTHLSGLSPQVCLDFPASRLYLEDQEVLERMQSVTWQHAGKAGNTAR